MQAMNTVLHNVSPLSSQQSTPVWITDSGATNHMTADLSNLSLSTPFPTDDTVHTANGEGLPVSHIGNSIISTNVKPIQLKSVLHVPKLAQNLLSVHKLCLDNDCRIIFDAFRFWIQDKVTGRILYRGMCSNGLYPLPFVSLHTGKSVHNHSFRSYLGQLVLTSTWHHRLGHPTNKVVTMMLNKAHIECSKDSNSVMCHSCLQGKFCKLPFQSNVQRSVIPFHIIHTDLWGPSPTVSVDGFRYYVLFVDDFSRYCWLFPLINKSDLYSVFVKFYTYIQTQFSKSIHILQSDGGGVY